MQLTLEFSHLDISIELNETKRIRRTNYQNTTQLVGANIQLQLIRTIFKYISIPLGLFLFFQK